MNEKINELYNKIDNQDKIINEQTLEIARLKQQKNKALKYIEETEKEFVHYFKYGKRFYKSDSFDDLKYILGEKENEL